jgi:hypothetical protein
VQALAPAPDGFTVAEYTARVHAATGATDTDYSTRQGACDLRKLRGKQLITKPGRSRRYQVPDDAARTIAALLSLRDEVIAPILAGVRSPRPGRKPATWTHIDRDYQALRIGMQTLFHDLHIDTGSPRRIDNLLSITIPQAPSLNEEHSTRGTGLAAEMMIGCRKHSSIPCGGETVTTWTWVARDTEWAERHLRGTHHVAHAVVSGVTAEHLLDPQPATRGRPAVGTAPRHGQLPGTPGECHHASRHPRHSGDGSRRDVDEPPTGSATRAANAESGTRVQGRRVQGRHPRGVPAATNPGREVWQGAGAAPPWAGGIRAGGYLLVREDNDSIEVVTPPPALTADPGLLTVLCSRADPHPPPPKSSRPAPPPSPPTTPSVPRRSGVHGKLLDRVGS